MTDAPKILTDRLRALSSRAPHVTMHPEADLLAAFAEQALSPAERDGVLEHLALCGECREVVALALPVSETVATPTSTEIHHGGTRSEPQPIPSRKLRFPWPTLRWAALAAGVAVAASLLMLRPAKLNQTRPSEAAISAPQQPPSATATRTAQSASLPADQMSAVATGKEVAAYSTAARTPALKAQAKIKRRDSAPQSAMHLATNRKQAEPADNLLAPPSAAATSSQPATSARPTNETVDVSAEAVEIQGANVGQPLLARNEAPPIEKAKPAPQSLTTQGAQTQPPQSQAEIGDSAAKGANPQSRKTLAAARMTANPAPALPDSPHVALTIAGGALQRSPDGGQSWQQVLHPGHPLLCYASRGSDAWAGGQAGTLFHSSDNGLTWAQIQPSINSRQLTADITHLDVPSPSEIVLSTANDGTWSSADGGKTWKKQ